MTILVIVYILYWSYSTKERIYYASQIDMYIRIERKSSNFDNLYIYLGKSKDDIYKESDYVKVRHVGDLRRLYIYLHKDGTLYISSDTGILDFKQTHYSMTELDDPSRSIDNKGWAREYSDSKNEGITHIVYVYNLSIVRVISLLKDFSQQLVPEIDD